MNIALGTDEYFPFHEKIVHKLHELGHRCTLFGAWASLKEEAWVSVAQQACEALLNGTCEEGILCCWTGTGISMAANKIPGIRAAFCPTPEIAQGARLWNHANVLVLSNHLLSNEPSDSLLESWFSPYDSQKGQEGVHELLKLENFFQAQGA